MKILNLLLVFILSSASLSSQQPTQLTEPEITSIATEAYIYGYPLVTMEMTRRVMTNTVVPEGTKAPMGQFVHARTYPDPSFKDVTAPNADTLYSLAWLDLSKEAYVLHLPEERNRYYLMPLLSGWTDVFASLGTRTTGDQGGDYLITGPNWKGQNTAKLPQLKSPTNLVWLIGRTYCSGTPEDYEIVHEIQDHYTLVPLSSYGKFYTPPRGKVDPKIDVKTPVRDQVNQMDGQTFFSLLASLMKNNPPTTQDAPMIAQMAKIGIIPGKEFDLKKLDPKIAKVVQDIPQIALKKIAAYENKVGQNINGWIYSLKTGTYGTDYLTRAVVAAIGLGANLPEDAVYPFTRVDSNQQPLNGANRYLLHFAKDQIPPVKGFWSLTMYNDHYFFVPNPIKRYAISPRDALKFNPDGSLDLYIQSTSPGKEKESNWLPAPKENFVLMLRLYWPQEPILTGSWKPPGVKKIQ